jgi:hypothetical protein
LRSAAVAAFRRDTFAVARSARANRDTGGRSGVAATWRCAIPAAV